MRFHGVVAIAVAAALAGCGGGGWFGAKKAEPASDAGLISKPIGPGLVSRCPIPVSYDDTTSKQIQEALDALPKDNVLRKVMTDYETERDNLRMCQ